MCRVGQSRFPPGCPTPFGNIPWGDPDRSLPLTVFRDLEALRTLKLGSSAKHCKVVGCKVVEAVEGKC